MPDAAPDDRLAALERAVLLLQDDVHQLRAALAERGGRAATSQPPAAPAPVAPPDPGPAHPALDALNWRLGIPPRRPTLGERAAAYARLQVEGLGVRTGPGGATPDLEAVVGRYGTVAVAALFVLLAAGAFLTWAVANYDLTPAARLGLGAAATAALAGAGLWLRARPVPAAAVDGDDADHAGARRFGDVLLALALAVTHVVAWAAGPYLRLVPPAAALGIAAAASAALAALAWRARQQALFLVGVGGALAAPFVTGSAEDYPGALRVYGWLVLSTALLAVPRGGAERDRWRGAFRLLALGGATYTAAHFGGPLAMAAIGNPAGLALPGWMLARLAPAVFALAVAAVPLGLALRPRPAADSADVASPDPRAPLAGLALAYLLAGAVALALLAVDGPGATGWTLALALAGTLMAHAALAPLTAPALTPRPPDPRRSRRGLTPVAAALALPLLGLTAALAGLDRVTGVAGALTAALWTAVGAAAAMRTWQQVPPAPADAPRPPLPSAHAAAAGFAAALVPVFLFSGRDVLRVTALAAVVAIGALTLRPLRHPLALLAPALTAGAAAAWAWTLLDARPRYAYVPFVTSASLAAGAVVAAWAFLARRVWRDGAGVFPTGERRLLVALALVVAIGWGREELAHAVAPDVATVLLIAYFAVVGIASIALGRARRLPVARQVGLALALYAAVKALLQASQLDAVGLRILSYLVVGGFFLGIAYWYRAAGSGGKAGRDDGFPLARE